MGGSRSLVRRHQLKRSTEAVPTVDIRLWQRGGLLTPGRSFHWQWYGNSRFVASINVVVRRGGVVIHHCHNEEKRWRNSNYTVYIDWTDCHFGSQRPWFLCPARSCGRRVAILYGNFVFACRQCHHLAYPSQNELPYDRFARRAERIRDRLGWEPGILNGKGSKPKGMHWGTFELLCVRHDNYVGKSLGAIASKLEL